MKNLPDGLVDTEEEGFLPVEVHLNGLINQLWIHAHFIEAAACSKDSDALGDLATMLDGVKGVIINGKTRELYINAARWPAEE